MLKSLFDIPRTYRHGYYCFSASTRSQRPQATSSRTFRRHLGWRTRLDTTCASIRDLTIFIPHVVIASLSTIIFVVVSSGFQSASFTASPFYGGANRHSYYYLLTRRKVSRMTWLVWDTQNCSSPYSPFRSLTVRVWVCLSNLRALQRRFMSFTSSL